MGQLEDFLERKPLNERLKRLSEGEDEDDLISPAAAEREIAHVGRADAANRPLDDNDRESLRRLTLEPGWPILLKMIDNRIQTQEDAVKAQSKRDPFAKDENAANWAYVGVMEQVRADIVAMLQVEIHILQANKAKEATEGL